MSAPEPQSHGLTPEPAGHDFLGAPSPEGIGAIYSGWASGDPRSSSTQSLVPSLSGHDDQEDPRRTLLIVYIHGFMGNDSSFRSFPAHVHSYLKGALADSHVIHSKIYPRYKTYKSINVARDNFSQWLEPHESPTTDVILIGHSMGGLLAADLVLMPQRPPNSSDRPFLHRILGTISLDSPFLGLHPGIIVSGIASLFRPAPPPPKDPGEPSSSVPSSPTPSGSLSPDPSLYSELSPLSGTTSPSLVSSPPTSISASVSASDPLFNPPFFNDVLFKDRGWLKNVSHFANKHKYENLGQAATRHIMSHLEFGGCLADYASLNIRYDKLRKLEEVDDVHQPDARNTPRVRFVNYYTISTGRVKKPKSQPGSPHLKPESAARMLSPQRSSLDETRSHTSSEPTPRISIEDYSDSGRPEILQTIEPMPEPDDDDDDGKHPPPYVAIDEPATAAAAEAAAEEGATAPPATNEDDASLPAIPAPPEEPTPPDLDKITDKDARKQAEKEAKRARKVYEQAVKDRERAIRERQKLVEKRRRKAAKDAERRDKDAAKETAAREKEARKAELATQRELDETSRRLEEAVEGEDKGKDKDKGEKKKERKFCMLPRKTGGALDPAWVRVDMHGVDEVGAHCGLFFAGPHYDRLVGDVGLRIVGWVHDDASRRVVLEEMRRAGGG